ncbi:MULTISPECIES: hypothetical protein [Actinomadura]|uniref:Nucleotide exchange factor GrpE n=1 Tax=Actinomadura yumaensis TaxID=111807 RepID=A0ABW2CXW1_9ACTN|nr:hypothetical protein [Actinomadura sp. J1-007]MWK35514.1 hypothetical protein [Actinomadura sp. J1-007]
MTNDRRNDADKPLADRRAEQGAPQEDAEQDFADEHAPGPTDPPNAEAEAPGGEEEGYSPQTEVP